MLEKKRVSSSDDLIPYTRMRTHTTVACMHTCTPPTCMHGTSSCTCAHVYDCIHVRHACLYVYVCAHYGYPSAFMRACMHACLLARGRAGGHACVRTHVSGAVAAITTVAGRALCTRRCSRAPGNDFDRADDVVLRLGRSWCARWHSIKVVRTPSVPQLLVCSRVGVGCGARVGRARDTPTALGSFAAG